jgi:hypothetical protein
MGWSIDAFQRNAFVCSGCGGQYGRKHGISNRLVPMAQDMEWVELYSLGIVNNDVFRPDAGDDLAPVLSSPHIAMSSPQMRSNLIGYRGEPTNLAYEKAVCGENNVGTNSTIWFRLQIWGHRNDLYSGWVLVHRCEWRLCFYQRRDYLVVWCTSLWHFTRNDASRSG